MSVIKGQNLRVMVGTTSGGTTTYKCIAAATSCSVHLSQTLEDSSTKDAVGGFTEQEVTGHAWDVSVDALFAVDTTAEQAIDLIDLVLGYDTVKLQFIQTKADTDQNRTAESAPAITLTGEAYCNDISISAQNKQNVTYTAQFTGNGALTRTK